MKRKQKRERGIALISVMGVLAIVAVATLAYITRATHTVRLARLNELESRLSHVCEAGIQDLVLTLWKPFKMKQSFDEMDIVLTGASTALPKFPVAGIVQKDDTYTTAIIGYSKPDSYKRLVTIRSVGWQDSNKNGALDSEEFRKIIDVTMTFSLARSEVFDYTYFVNNYGWMNGFGPNDLIVNGDMRANGDFDFSGGTPTINGSVFATANNKLVPPAKGLVNITPNQWSNWYYNIQPDKDKVRQAWVETRHGAKGSEEFERWRDFLYDKEGAVINNRLYGAVIGDSRGYRTYDGKILDSTPTKEVVMPDLNDITKYIKLSMSYVDTKAKFDNGATNPDYGKGAYVEVYNTTLRKYVRVDTNGVVAGSAILIGTSGYPIKIHGPVTFTQDCVIKGYVQGQGTIYTGRNVHIVGSIYYKNPPIFSGNNPDQIDKNNTAKDILGLAARGSIMMGNTAKFGFPYPLKYMTPPFTKGRYDENGNWIPPFDAMQIDETGNRRYQSVFGDAKINSIAQPINNLDCILYTNFLGGGRLADGGMGVKFNGSIISRDEAMVIYSLPMVMNYDHRIRERLSTQQPLIDIFLPRSPVVMQAVWQDRGLYKG